MLMFGYEHFTHDTKTMVCLLVASEIAFIIHMIEEDMLWFTSSNTPLVLQCLSMTNQNLVTKVVLLPLRIVKYLLSCQHILV